MFNPSDIKTVAATLADKELAAERERAPKLASECEKLASECDEQKAKADLYDPLLEAAEALTTALEADSATIAGCATQIAALKALYPDD